MMIRSSSSLCHLRPQLPCGMILLPVGGQLGRHWSRWVNDPRTDRGPALLIVGHRPAGNSYGNQLTGWAVTQSGPACTHGVEAVASACPGQSAANLGGQPVTTMTMQPEARAVIVGVDTHRHGPKCYGRRSQTRASPGRCRRGSAGGYRALTAGGHPRTDPFGIEGTVRRRQVRALRARVAEVIDAEGAAPRAARGWPTPIG